MTGISSSCGACKFLRRKCTRDCVFAPFYSYDQAAAHFAAVHKVFGASNVSRLLLHLPEHRRAEATLSLSFEALTRVRDPVYGCVAYIYALQQQVANLQEEIEVLGNHMAAASGLLLPQPSHYNINNAQLDSFIPHIMLSSSAEVGLAEASQMVQQGNHMNWTGDQEPLVLSELGGQSGVYDDLKMMMMMMNGVIISQEEMFESYSSCPCLYIN